MQRQFSAAALLVLLIVSSADAQAVTPAGGAPPGVSETSLLRQAEAMRQQRNFGAAAELLRQAMRTGPASARYHEAAARLGLCLEAAAKWDEAVSSYDEAIRRGRMDYWTAVALHRKAAVCTEQGCAELALDAIARLRAQFPDSSQSVQAGLLEDRIKNRDNSVSLWLATKEAQAAARYDQAVAGRKDTAACLQLLEQVIQEYGDTPSALRAAESRAHLLAAAKRRDEAVAAFESILAQLEAVAPQSRIALTAKVRLAGLYHTSDQKEAKLHAIRLCDEVMAAGDSPLRPRASILAAAAGFEIIQKGSPAEAADWATLRQRCQAVTDSSFATRAERARAETIAIETLCWEGRGLEAVARAAPFLKEYDAASCKQDVATVLFFAGEELQALGRHKEALDYYRRVVQLYKGQQEIWPGMDHLPRTYYRIWETLRQSKAPKKQIESAASALLASFPDSSYASRVALVMKAEGR